MPTKNKQTSRVSKIRVISINGGITAKQGEYKGKPLTVVNVTELESNKGLKINLRDLEKQRTNKWLGVAQPGNVLQVYISRFDKGTEFVDREKGFEVVDIKQTNLLTPVRNQEPARVYENKDQAKDLVNESNYEEAERYFQVIRQANQEIKRAEEELAKIFNKIKEDNK